MTSIEPESAPHQWPGCPWPGWALLYARLIRELRAMDPALVVENVWDNGELLIGSIMAADETADAVFDRIEKAEAEARTACVVCGGLANEKERRWPPLCDEHR
ncbi:hypothetical protein [Mycobacterium sp. OTB74]|uniref:hypothetical protein n=1 Tax=Mycobacterium sp. OTB74 TaxID=1853452 RepID=UPI002476792A|nr:hypothetical protein [Mycobacterium sp. OTB74]MDH6245538.1 hypothetical protein [Mycobacterium sp. OTB74]